MREIILIFTYVICAFLPIFIILGIRTSRIRQRLFWISWTISLIGAFFGGVFGSILLHRFGLNIGFIADVLPAFIGAWVFFGLFFLLRSMPGNW